MVLEPNQGIRRRSGVTTAVKGGLILVTSDQLQSGQVGTAGLALPKLGSGRRQRSLPLTFFLSMKRV